MKGRGQELFSSGPQAGYLTCAHPILEAAILCIGHRAPPEGDTEQGSAGPSVPGMASESNRCPHLPLLAQNSISGWFPKENWPASYGHGPVDEVVLLGAGHRPVSVQTRLQASQKLQTKPSEHTQGTPACSKPEPPRGERLQAPADTLRLNGPECPPSPSLAPSQTPMHSSVSGSPVASGDLPR